jgi:uncharacterized protein
MMRTRGFSILAAVLLVACSSTPKDQFYVLGAAEAPAPNTAARYTVSIHSISLPDAVDRLNMVTYQRDNRVEILEHERWAESLRGAIPAAIARELRIQLPEARVAVYPQAASADALCRVQLDVQRFESRLNDSALIEALWSVRCGDRAQHGRSLVREQALGSYDALPKAHTRALSQIAKEIAPAVRSASGK